MAAGDVVSLYLSKKFVSERKIRKMRFRVFFFFLLKKIKNDTYDIYLILTPTRSTEGRLPPPL